MKNSPNPGNEPEPTSGNEPAQTSTRSLRRKPWRRLAILFSIILLTGIGGASAWAWFFVYMQLAPLVQNTVSKALSRPVRMGKVESFSFNGMRFAATELPATATDTDRGSAQAMEVKYNLLKLLLSRTVELDVTLIKPKVYIEQDVNREWIGTRIKTLPKGAIDVKLQYMRLRDAEVVLVPRGEAGNSKAPVLLNLASGTSHFLNNNQLIQFNTQGALVNGGNFTIQGESRPAVGETNLVISGTKVGAAEVGRLIQLPLLLQAGHVDGNLEIKIQPKQPLKFAGTATLNQVTARLPQLQKPFANTNGQLRFKGTQVRLEKITTLFGQIPALANGVVDTQSDINLSAQTAPVELPKILQAFDFQKLPVAVLAEVQTDLRVTGPLSKPVVSGEVRTTKLAQVDRLTFQAVSGGFQVVDSLLTINNFRATPTVGGLVTGTGQVRLGQKGTAEFDAQAIKVPGDAIAKIYAINLPVPLGAVSGRTRIVTALDKPQNYRATGSANLNLAGGTVTASNIQVAEERFTAQVQASGVQLGRLASVPAQLNGPLSGTFNLSGSLASLSPSTIRGSGSGRLNVAGGTVNATDVQLANGRFTAQVRANGVQLASLAPVPAPLNGPLSGAFNLSGSLTALSPTTIRGSGSGSLTVAGGTVNATDVQLADGRFTAQVRATGLQLNRLAQVPPQLNEPVSGIFNLSGSLASFSPSTIRGSGSGRLNVGGGTVTANNIQLADGRFTAQVRTTGVQIAGLAPVPPQLGGPLSGTFNLSGSLDNFSPSTIRGSGSGRLSVAGGTVTATDLQLADGRFQAVVEPTGVQLAGFSPDLRGSLGGKLNVSGSLAALSPTAIQASGQVNFSEGIALIDRPLTASFNWNGQQLQIQQAIANGFNANGVVNVNLANAGLQAIQGFDLNVQATDLNLQQLPATLPNAVNLAGRADFSGRIAGTPTAPNLNGELQLRNFVAAGLTFKPLLVGNVNAVPGQGVNLQLIDPTDQSPTADKIVVALGSDYRPVSFDVRAQGAGATGTREGEELVVNVAEFPIELLKKLAPVPPVIATQPLSGVISGNLNVNLNTFDVALNNVELNGAIFAQARGDRSPGVNSRYVLSGKIARTVSGPQFQSVKLYVDPEKPGELQTLIAALEVFDLFKANSSFDATKGNLAVAPILFPNETLQTQLERLSEIKALEQQRELREAASPLPSLAEVRGRFSGIVTLNGSLASGISTQVNIQGENWEWGSSEENQTSYKLNAVSVIGEGSFQNGIATLLPLRIQSGDSVISYSGSFGGDAQSGQLRLEKIPIDQLQLALQRIPNIPQALLGFTGLLNATATLSGSINNPQARGDVTIDPDSNQAQVQRVQGGFSYANARLNFGSTIQVAGAESSTINGSIPYKLPVATVAPADNKLSLNINVQNQGLVLLNLLSGGQVSWIDGTGNVQLDINGIFDQQTNKVAQLVAVGQGNVENATLAASALPEGDRLTNVTGKILFDLDRIRIVDTLTGQFSDGTVTVAGNIPFYQPAPQENPLMVDIGELALNLKGLYRGRVQGNVVITGTALAPKIGGQVNLFDGQVSLAERTATTEAGGGAGSGRGAGANSSNAVEFNGLQLSLGKGIQITRAPILNFLAEGGLTINGPLDNLRPEGTIRLKRGQVNLFTTQFRLARSYEQTAKFFPNQGLDPTLDVRLTASVTESTQRRLPTDPLSAEISDVPVSSLGSVRTVDIQARVDGPASQIATNLELTSSPGRSQSEIVALLGGSFVDTLGRGDTTLGLANLAGSALLGNVQNIIGDALGLSEFRLFPTIISDDKQRTSTLGLAAEAGVDLTRNFSVSVSKILTTEQPFEYSLRYRLNEQLLLRGATNLSGESRAAVEYEKRF